MSNHPINLGVRFILEITALIIVGYWGFHFYNGFMGYLVGIGTPLLMGTIWGVFAVANDPSRSGKTVVNTPGFLRLCIELAYFGFSSYAFFSMEFRTLGFVFTAVVLIHYIVSYDRIKWLLSQN